MCICVYTRNMVCITKFHIVPSSIHPKATVAAVAAKLSFSYLQLRKRAQQLIIFFHAICRENKLFFARWHQLLICLYQQDDPFFFLSGMFFSHLLYSSTQVAEQGCIHLSELEAQFDSSLVYAPFNNRDLLGHAR